MPKMDRGGNLHQKRRAKEKQLGNQNIPELNIPTPTKSDNRLVKEATPWPQNKMIDIETQCTLFSVLTSSVVSIHFSTVTDAKSVADDMVKTL